MENLGIGAHYYPSSGGSSNFVEDLKGLDNLKNLKELFLCKDITEEDLKHLEKHNDTLENLSITSMDMANGTKDLSLFGNMNKLKNLSLSNMLLKDGLFINKMKNLNNLGLGSIGFENNFSINSASLKVLSCAWMGLPNSIFDGNNSIEDFSMKGQQWYDSVSSIDFDFSNLSKLKNVKKIGIRYIHVSDISFLNELTNLEELSLISNKDIKDIGPLKDLLKLKELSISDNKITDLTPLINLAQNGKLEHLSLNDNSLLNPNSKKNQPLFDILNKKQIKYYVDGYWVTELVNNIKNDIKNIEMENLGTLGVLISKKSTPIEELITSENFPALDRYDVNVVTHSGAGKKLGNVGSKDRIQIVNSIGDLIKEYTVVVPGDVTGNGLAKMYDAFQILNDSLRRTKIDELDTAIRDYDGDGNVRMYDAVQYMKESLLD